MKVAMKWHKQFSHPRGDKLKTLIKNAGITDKDMLEMVYETWAKCKTCNRYGRQPPKPIVTLPRATDFNESVAIDLKFINSKPIMHIIDHFSRYSAACVIPSKDKDIIIANILKIWISVFGCPKKILADMGREFDNKDYREMGEKLNTIVKSSAAESPWSNGVNERHNGILGEMITKTMEDSKCSLQTAVAWAVSAKNSLANVNGYSPNQLVFGKNPNYPCYISDKLPALNSNYSSNILLENLSALHSAREAFIKAEASQKLRLATCKRTRNSTAKNFQISDSVYYKKNDDGTLTWRGPGRIIGIDGPCVVIRHGAAITTVPACRVKLENSEFTDDNIATPTDNDGNNILTNNDGNNTLMNNDGNISSYNDFESDDDDYGEDQNKIASDNDVISIDNPSSSNSVDVSDDHDIQPPNINQINNQVSSNDGTNSDDKQIENREKNRSLPKVKTTVLELFN